MYAVPRAALLFLLAVMMIGYPLAAQEQTRNPQMADRVRLWNQQLTGKQAPAGAAQVRAGVVSLIRERAKAMLTLMQDSPAEALALALSEPDSITLGTAYPEALADIESHGVWRGTMEVLVEDDFEHGTARTRHRLMLGSEKLDVYFAGKPPQLKCGQSASFQGIRLGKAVVAGEVVPDDANAATGAGCSPLGAQTIAVILVSFPVTPFPLALPRALSITHFLGRGIHWTGTGGKPRMGRPLPRGVFLGHSCSIMITPASNPIRSGTPRSTPPSFRLICPVLVGSLSFCLRLGNAIGTDWVLSAARVSLPRGASP